MIYFGKFIWKLNKNSLFTYRRAFFLEKSDNKRFPKKKPSTPIPTSAPVKVQKLVNLTKEEKRIVEEYTNRYNEAKDVDFELNNEYFNNFVEMKNREELLKDKLLTPEYSLIVKHKNEFVNEEFVEYPSSIDKINMHSQLRANLERMEIKELNNLQKIIFHLQINKLNVLIRSDKLSTFNRRFTYLFPTIYNLLSKKEIPKNDPNIETTCPMTIIVEKDREIIDDIWENAKMLCFNTGITVSKLYSKDSDNKFYNKINRTEILITSPDRIQELLRNGSICSKDLDNVVINNFNNTVYWEKNIINDLAQTTRKKIHLTVFCSRMTDAVFDFRKRFLYNHYYITYGNKDKIEDDFDKDVVHQVNEKISHLAIVYDSDKLNIMWEKIKNLLISVDGIRLGNHKIIVVQVQGIKYIDIFISYLRVNNIIFTFISDKNSANIIISEKIIVTTDLFLISGLIVKKLSLIININVPYKPKNFFSLIGKNGDNIGSTITFVNRYEKKVITDEFITCLREYNQKIPDWLEKK